jgi:surface polysaccharide O-acyltransferase-like enzyme
VADAVLTQWHIPGGFTLAFYVCAFAAALGLYALYTVLPRAVLAPQAWIGRRTLGIYASSEVFASGLVLAGVHAWPLVFVLSMAGSLVVTLVLERTQLTRTLLLGKPWRRVVKETGG